MGRLFKFLFWFLVCATLAIVADQLLLRTPSVHPAHAAVREFYRDFRSRLLEIIVIVPPKGPQSIEAVIDHERKPDRQAPAAAGTGDRAPVRPETEQAHRRYVYVDQEGVLQFADSRADIPEAYRDSAQPLGE